VHERTRELESAMDQLGEKSRNEATLAERSRLAGEIHDSMQQGLSGSILHLDTTMNHPSITPEVHAKLNVVRNMLAYSREEVQQAVWNLESPLLQNSTLGDALRKIAGYISSGTMTIEVSAPAEPAALPPATRHHLLRIAQEAITNAVKHAGANRIRVTLETRGAAVILSVSDDGRGFEPVSAARDERHFGLRGLSSRARSIRADLRISSSPGAGTTVRVTVPASPASSS
jgi:signal transduction histidine kinase